jgi:hypothetical protein
MEVNYSFAVSLGFEAIRPIFSPLFSLTADIPFSDEELVLGVARDGEVKAYWVSVLRCREMVNDELAGIPNPEF